MNRGTKPDTNSPENTTTTEPAAPDTSETKPVSTASTPAPTTAPGTPHEPYPGNGFFHGGRNSPIVQAMARRLQQEGHWDTAQSPGPDWTNAHKRAFASFQHTLRPKEGGDVSGIPDEVAWDRLQVPRVSPTPKED